LKIRPTAICVIRRCAGDASELLLLEGFDRAKQEAFLRPLGGGIEFGERSQDAVVREIREELGARIVSPRLLGVLENIFTFEARDHHEVVFVYEAELEDRSLLEKDALPAFEADGSPIKTVWRSLASIEREGPRLVPTGLLELLLKPAVGPNG
jgi:8-oxo-dGTP pyrophosphatase MutT (NUDIX family)